jgi:tRNA (mo5U34)-methyltransferase
MPSSEDLLKTVQSLEWYHSIDLGNGIVTPGHYDHRPYLQYYRLPEDLHGKTVIDIGAASGFFSFEFERRGAAVTATDLPEWFDHDFGPNYRPDKTSETGASYLHSPFEFARQALGSKASRKLINIYDISPETVGAYDLAFCGSVLLHLTDPLKALWNIASVTREKAIIVTVIEPEEPLRPTATLVGHQRGDVWWIPTRACLELMAVTAGFVGIEWVSEFNLDYRDGSPGPYHGVLHAYKTDQGWTSATRHRDEVIAGYQNQTRVDAVQLQQENQRLTARLQEIENSRLHQLANRLRQMYAKLRT